MRAQVAGTDPATWHSPALYQLVRSTPSTTRPTCCARWPRTGRRCCGTRSGWTPASSAAYAPVAGRRAALPGGPGPARRALRRATSTCRPTTSPPPTSAASGPTATWRWPGRPRVCSPCCSWRWRSDRPSGSGCSGAVRRRARPRCGRCSSPPPVPGGWPACRRRPVAPTGCWCGRCRRRRSWLSRAAFTWFAAPAHLVVTLGAWLLFAALLRWAGARARPVPPVGRARRRRPAAHGAAAGGAGGARAGPLLVRLLDRRRCPASAYVTVAFAAFCWLFVVVAMVLRHRYGLLRGGAGGTVAAAAGLTLAVVAGAIAVVGLERR